MVDINRDLSYDDAVEIALAAKELERTGVMESDAAAEFLANEMRKSEGLRFACRRASKSSSRQKDRTGRTITLSRCSPSDQATSTLPVTIKPLRHVASAPGAGVRLT
jgi:hypothetical protein